MSAPISGPFLDHSTFNNAVSILCAFTKILTFNPTLIFLSMAHNYNLLK